MFSQHTESAKLIWRTFGFIDCVVNYVSCVIWGFYANTLGSVCTHHPSLCVGTESQYLSAAVLWVARPGSDQVVGGHRVGATVQGTSSPKLRGVTRTNDVRDFEKQFDIINSTKQLNF